MNPEHLKAVVWLRWRLKRNQFQRGGVTNAVLGGILAVVVAATAVGAFFYGLAAGAVLLPAAQPSVRLYVWDGLVVAMLIFWSFGLLFELQRAEGLALDRFLHLPVSPFGAFLINYLGTWVGVTTVVFVPGIVGLILGGAYADGPLSLLGLPLLLAFLFALTSVTYQFQSWLASLMSNPRRRRTVVVLLTGGFILLAQTPSLMNIYGPWRNRHTDAAKRNDQTQQAVDRMNARNREAFDRNNERDTNSNGDLTDKRITREQYRKRVGESQAEYDEELERVRSEYKADLERVQIKTPAEVNPLGGFVAAETVVRLVNIVLPPGWLPLGAAGLAAGDPVPTLLGGIGFCAIGAVCLRRAYRTTIRLYTGQLTSGSGVASAVADVDPAKVWMVEWRLPCIPERAVGVAAAGLRSLLRAPEVKMLMIAPVILTVVAVGVMASTQSSLPAVARPFVAAGVAALIVLPVLQLVGNQFGYDRNGFRAYVLGPVRRRDILLGKNLASAPFGLFPAAVAVLVVAVVYPMRVDRLLAVPLQTMSLFLLACVVGNGLAIHAPIPIAAGGFKPGRIRLGPALVQGLGFFVYPMILMVTLIPLGADALLSELGGFGSWPVGLALSLVGFGLSVLVYRWGLAEQGQWLANREQAILEVVTGREE